MMQVLKSPEVCVSSISCTTCFHKHDTCTHFMNDPLVVLQWGGAVIYQKDAYPHDIIKSIKEKQIEVTALNATTVSIIVYEIKTSLSLGRPRGLAVKCTCSTAGGPGSDPGLGSQARTDAPLLQPC